MNVLNFKLQNERSKIVLKNILGSGGLKVVNILSTLLVIPMTIHYVNGERYGIWLTMSSIIAWMSYFDFGLGHGFRNKFTEAVANNNLRLAKEIVSTTYGCLVIIFGVLLAVLLVGNVFIDWSSVLRVSNAYNAELTVVFSLMALSLCINSVVNTFGILLTADQKSALASLIQTVSQVFGLVGVFAVTHLTQPSLIKLTIVYTLVPSFVILLSSLYAYKFTIYRQYTPEIRLFRKDLIRDIVGLGGKFFIIMLSTLVIFQCINIIISRLLGAIEVTRYNVVYKYFNVAYMFSVIVLVPFWSAFTEAYVKQDFRWMKEMLRKLELFGACSVAAIVVMIFAAETVLKVWIGKEITVPFSTIMIVGLYILTLNIGGIYMYLINGIGKIVLQMYLYIIFAIIAIPAMMVLGKYYNLLGIMTVPISVYTVQAIVSRIQLKRIINNSATGIWNK